jgi:hypothetical protein
MAQDSPKRCIFCGSTEKLTYEDTWPEWTRPSTRTLPGKKARQSLYTYDVLTERPNIVGKMPRLRRRIVCRACNNGWMSRLENATKPLLEPLIFGRSHELSSRDRMVLATWAVKTAVTLNEVSPGSKLVFPAAIYEHFTQVELEPPPRHRVYVSRVVPTNPRERDHVHGRMLSGPVQAASLVYLMVGDVIFRVVGDFVGSPSPPYPERFSMLWPVQGPINWTARQFPRAGTRQLEGAARPRDTPRCYPTISSGAATEVGFHRRPLP